MKKLDAPALPENPSVKIIGLGGVGAIIGRYVCLFLSAPSLNEDTRIVFIDGDDYEPKNSSRMLFKKLGNKAKTMREEMLEYLDDSRVTIIAVPEYVTPDNIEGLIQDGDFVFLAVDNHKTRQTVDQWVQFLDNIVLISAGNDPEGEDASGKELRGSFGNCQIYVRKDGKEVTNSLSQYHPEIADPQDSLPTEESCSDVLTSVPQILFTNMQAAACACQAFYRILANGPLHGEVTFDTVDALMRPSPYPTPQDRAVAAQKDQEGQEWAPVDEDQEVAEVAEEKAAK